MNDPSAADRIEFFTNPFSRGQIARWALEEAGADYEQKLIAYGEEIKGDAYRAINPMGKVPAIRHRGIVVTETAAICAYLADAFPDAKLAPPPQARGDYYRWLFFGAGPLEQAVTDRAMGLSPKPEQQRMAGYGTYELMVGTLARALGEREWLGGAHFTAADLYIGAHVIWGMQFKTLPERPEFLAYADRMKQRPAYQRAKAIDDALIAASEAQTATEKG